ncbi:right-handed parallel beta-helix repeat-containing protein [Micromonospora sp. NPDC049559]|uniref:right-handed parallel beta-helix repeat-containing protein n=1 Tax=Micromonospora sp. NPDC049559 TaxID=3155923 RepID=UPI00343AFAD7
MALLDQANPVLRVGEGGLPNIRSAVKAAGAGAVIEIAGGTYREELDIAKAIELRAADGSGPVHLVHKDAPLTIRANAVVRGISIAVSGGGWGDAVRIEGAGAAPLIEDCRISASNGSAVSASAGAKPTVRGCRIESSDGSGAWVEERGTVLVMERCAIERSRSGVSVYAGGLAVLTGSNIDDIGYMAVSVSGRNTGVELTGCTISAVDGTAVQVQDHCTAKLTDCQISGADWGADVYGRGASATVTRSKIENTGYGGIKVADQARLTVTDSTLSGGRAALQVEERAIVVADNVTSEDSTGSGLELYGGDGRFTGCRVTGAAQPGVYMRGGTMFFDQCEVSGAAGAGFYISGGAASLTRCIARENQEAGFALHVDAALTACASYANGEEDEVGVQRGAPVPVTSVDVGGRTVNESRPEPDTRPAAEQGEPQAPTSVAAEGFVHESLAELDALIGLAEVKAQVRTLIDIIVVGQRRAAAGLKTPPMSRHLVFTGNPGTGKTTVARIYGRILAALGLLAKGHLVESARVDLVAEHVGGTAVKTKKVFNRARGGVLFIDEAYALAPEDAARDFGREAIDTLVKLMEDHRDEVVVIVAGYTGEMARFIAANPGLESRFGRTIEFPDYSASELVRITESLATSHDYTLTEETRGELLAYYAQLHRGVGFGNGRTARRTFETMVAEHANRIAKGDIQAAAELTTLLPEDLPDEWTDRKDPAA